MMSKAVYVDDHQVCALRYRKHPPDRENPRAHVVVKLTPQEAS